MRVSDVALCTGVEKLCDVNGADTIVSVTCSKRWRDGAREASETYVMGSFSVKSRHKIILAIKKSCMPSDLRI